MYRISAPKIGGLAALIAGAAVLILITLQYPISSTFPMGGDAPYYITVAKHAHTFFATPLIAIRAVLRSSYPATAFIFSVFSLVPLPWPINFMWWTVIGQLGVGAAAAWLLWRIGSLWPGSMRWYMAGAGLAIWGLTPVDFNNHFEEGTISQLWSLIFLLLCLERLLANSWKGMNVALVLTILSHPISALVILTTLGVSAAPLLTMQHWLSATQRRGILILSSSVLALFIVSAGLLWQHRNFLYHVVSGGGYLSIGHYLTSSIGPLILLAPIGLFFVLHRPSSLSPGTIVLTSFAVVALLFAFSDQLGVEAWTRRFHTYNILAITLLSAVALPLVIQKAIRPPLARGLFATILFISLVLPTWTNNARIYAYYENPERLHRLHPAEQAGMLWLEQNLPANQKIIGVYDGRIPEWINALTSHTWAPRTNIKIEDYAAVNPATPNSEKYLVFFLRREDIPSIIEENPEIFQLLYNNTFMAVFSNKQS